MPLLGYRYSYGIYIVYWSIAAKDKATRTNTGSRRSDDICDKRFAVFSGSLEQSLERECFLCILSSQFVLLHDNQAKEFYKTHAHDSVKLQLILVKLSVYLGLILEKIKIKQTLDEKV